jgi:hypothetical protein
LELLRRRPRALSRIAVDEDACVLVGELVDTTVEFTARNVLGPGVCAGQRHLGVGAHVEHEVKLLSAETLASLVGRNEERRTEGLPGAHRDQESDASEEILDPTFHYSDSGN